MPRLEHAGRHLRKTGRLPELKLQVLALLAAPGHVDDERHGIVRIRFRTVREKRQTRRQSVVATPIHGPSVARNRTDILFRVRVRRLRHPEVEPHRDERMARHQVLERIVRVVQTERAWHPAAGRTGEVVRIRTADAVVWRVFGKDILVGPSCLDLPLAVEELPSPHAAVVRREAKEIVGLLGRPLRVGISLVPLRRQQQEYLEREIAAARLHEFRHELVGAQSRPFPAFPHLFDMPL